MNQEAARDPSLILTFGEQRDELQPGDRLGNWRLVSELGTGGMGRVYLAERSDGHYEQRAAIKLLQGWNSDDGLEQLARERQILASLAHPHIARLMDGGTTPLGRPYLVMDYVEGVPIHEHVRAARVDLAGVLALFNQVLHAVAYAHRHLVVHCDLKPGNVLVTPEGRAVLLDFGIARLQGGGGETLHDVVTWTPRYASPEQQRGLKPGIPSDIFSLGRMLDDLLGLVQPAPPRAREWKAIVARATADDPDKRYPTAVSMAEDLRRFLDQRPLQALPRTPGYVAAKLLRRRWPWALVSVAALAASVAFTIGLMRERDRARAAEQLARAEAASTRAVSDFVVSLFEGADPALSGQPDMPASVLVQRGRQRIDTELPDQPRLQADMKAVLAKVLENTGRTDLAEQLYREAAALEARPDVARPERRAQVLARLANEVANAGRGSEALAPAREALAVVDALPEPAPLLRAEVLNTLGRVLAATGRYDEAETHLQASLGLRRAALPPDDPAIGATLHNLGLLHWNAGHYEASERHYRDALAIKLRRHGDGHPSTFGTLESLGRTLAQLRRLDEAEALFRRSLAERRRYYGERSPSVGSVLNELGNVLQDAGRTADAVQAYRESVAVHAGTPERRTMADAIAINNLATALEELGDMGAAETAYRESLTLRQALLKPDDLGLQRARHNLGRLLMRLGRLTEAQVLIEGSTAQRAGRLPPTHRELLDSRLTLAELQLGLQQRAASQATLELVAPHEAAMPPQRRASLRRLQGLLARAQGRGADALALHGQALDLARGVLPPGHPGLQRYALDAAESAQLLGHGDEARARLAEVWPALQRHPVSSPLRRQAERLQGLLQRTDRPPRS